MTFCVFLIRAVCNTLSLINMLSRRNVIWSGEVVNLKTNLRVDLPNLALSVGKETSDWSSIRQGSRHE